MWSSIKLVDTKLIIIFHSRLFSKCLQINAIIQSHYQPSKSDIIIPILQAKKLKVRELKLPAQRHRVSKWTVSGFRQDRVLSLMLRDAVSCGIDLLTCADYQSYRLMFLLIGAVTTAEPPQSWKSTLFLCSPFSPAVCALATCTH